MAVFFIDIAIINVMLRFFRNHTGAEKTMMMFGIAISAFEISVAVQAISPTPMPPRNPIQI